MYQLIQQHIFGGVELTANMDLIATAIASFGVIFLVALPFTIVVKIINVLTR